MPDPQTDRVVCQICHESKPRDEMMPAGTIRPSVAELITKQHPDFSPEGYICLTDLQHFRGERVRALVEQELGELSETETEVVKSFEAQQVLAKNINDEFDRELTLGQRVADKVAAFGGSWAFILIFIGIILCWMTANVILLARHPFDPYPFMALNLVLSCLAALQAPVIMMSQNRQETKDRMRAEHDYQVNLKAELEIRGLNARIDELLKHQWQGLLEIQQVQTDMMEQLVRHTQAESGTPPAEGAGA
jgi:uncharacterized membrane protein